MDKKSEDLAKELTSLLADYNDLLDLYDCIKVYIDYPFKSEWEEKDAYGRLRYVVDRIKEKKK